MDQINEGRQTRLRNDSNKGPNNGATCNSIVYLEHYLWRLLVRNYCYGTFQWRKCSHNTSSLHTEFLSSHSSHHLKRQSRQRSGACIAQITNHFFCSTWLRLLSISNYQIRTLDDDSCHWQHCHCNAHHQARFGRASGPTLRTEHGRTWNTTGKRLRGRRTQCPVGLLDIPWKVSSNTWKHKAHTIKPPVQVLKCSWPLISQEPCTHLRTLVTTHWMRQTNIVKTE